MAILETRNVIIKFEQRQSWHCLSVITVQQEMFLTKDGRKYASLLRDDVIKVTHRKRRAKMDRRNAKKIPIRPWPDICFLK